MKLKLMSLAMFAALLGAFVLAPISSQAKPAAAAVPINVTGVTDAGDSFAGVVTLTNVVSDAGNLFGVGTLTGTLTGAAGGTVTDVPVSLPLAVSGTCDILHLDLGPLDLDVLGLVVHLDEVVLDITAQSGAGNLLGNLLCAVTHLLDSNASGNALANLLTRILGLLG
jgi:hypothetical protein